MPEEAYLLQWALCPQTWGRARLRPAPGIKHPWLTMTPRCPSEGLPRVQCPLDCHTFREPPARQPKPARASYSETATEPSLSSQGPRWSEPIASGLGSAGGEPAFGNGPHPRARAPLPTAPSLPHVFPRDVPHPGPSPRPLPSPFPVASWGLRLRMPPLRPCLPPPPLLSSYPQC